MRLTIKPNLRSAVSIGRQSVMVLACGLVWLPIASHSAPRLWTVHANQEPLAMVLHRFAEDANVEVRSFTSLQGRVTLHAKQRNVDDILHQLLRFHSYIHRTTADGHSVWILSGPTTPVNYREPSGPLKNNPLADVTHLATEDNVDLATITQAAIDIDPRVRMEAVVGLGEHGDAASLAWLAQAINDADQRVRIAAVDSLENIGGAPATRILAEALSHPDAATRESAAYGLAAIGGPMALAALTSARDDPDIAITEIISELIDELELPQHSNRGDRIEVVSAL